MSFQKNPPWQKNVGLQNFQQLGLQFNQLTPAFNNFQQTQFANFNMPNSNQMQISYPPRINQLAFQTQVTPQQSSQQTNQQNSSATTSSSSTSKYNSNFKTFSGTGKVTKIQNDIGFIDDEVLFHKNVCINGIPKVRDLVLVEANFNQQMPFKWNATRVQVLTQQPSGMGSSGNQESGAYMGTTQQRDSNSNMDHRSRSRFSEEKDRRRRSSRDRMHDDESDRKRRRGGGGVEERSRPRESAERRDTRSPVVSSTSSRDRRPISPKRRRTHIVPRYTVHIPKISLSLLKIDVMEARRRYQNLYIPSDFVVSDNKWNEVFPMHKPLSLERPCSFQIMKDVNSIDESVEKTVLDPSDADYTWSAKVMLMSIPAIHDLYKKCIVRAEDKDEKSDDFEKDFIHPTRLISFLVGIRGKNESMAIGGPWSKKYDGENPDTDPGVLIKTAIRTCKALTGIDLSKCTQWYRFLELKYRRAEQVSKEKGDIIKPARIENVVIFLPDIYSCVPNRYEWEILQQQYKQACEKFLSASNDDEGEEDDVVEIIPSSDDVKMVIDNVGNNENVSVATETTSDDAVNAVELNDGDDESTKISVTNNPQMETAGDEDDVGGDDVPIAPSVAVDEDGNEVSEEQSDEAKFDIKNLKVSELRAELASRNLSTKGLKNELIERLENVLKEQNLQKKAMESTTQIEDVEMKVTDEVGGSDDIEDGAVKDNDGEMNLAEMDISEVTIIDEYDSTKDEKIKINESKKKTEVKKKFDEKEKAMWEKRYHLQSDHPSILVHPSKTAKNGKFDCAVVSLSVLLDYRKDDSKEHSFEISLFAEAFNEMLTRDFGFTIFKAFNYFNSIKTKEESSDKTKDATTTSVESDKINEQKDVKAKKPEDSDSDRSKEKGQEKKVKLITAYPDLLLSFCYFDQTQCGYIFEKDIEELFYCIGLNLSRSQVRKLTEKFISRDAFYYRKLTDCPAESVVENPLDKVSAEELKALANGNRSLPAIATTATSSNSDIVIFEGSTVSVKQTVNQMRRAEKAYEESEKLLVDLRKSNADLKSINHKNEKKIKDLNADYKSVSRKLQDAESNLSSMTRKYNECFSVISTIHERVTPIVVKAEKSRDRDKNKSTDKKSTSTSKDEKKSETGKDEKCVGGEIKKEKPVASVADEKKTEESATVVEEKQEEEMN